MINIFVFKMCRPSLLLEPQDLILLKMIYAPFQTHAGKGFKTRKTGKFANSKNLLDL